MNSITMGNRIADLTERERQILAHVATGQRNKEIARKLCISEATVENHLHHVFGKLGVKNRVQAASWAFKCVTVAFAEDEGNPSRQLLCKHVDSE